MATAVRKPSPIMSAAGRKSWETRRINAGLLPPKPKKKVVLPAKKKLVLPKPGKAPTADEIMMKTVILSIEFNAFGNRRQVDKDEVLIRGDKTQIDKRLLNTTKKLIDADELNDIHSHYNKIKSYVTSRALPTTIKDGIYLLSNDLQEEMETKLKESVTALTPMVDVLVTKLRVLKADAKARLGKLYDEEDYLTASEMRERFRIHWRWLFVDSMKDRQGVSREVYEAEKKKAAQDWAETRATVRGLIRAEFAEKVNHFIERLSEQDELGNKKNLPRQGALDKFEEFFNLLPYRDIDNDVQLRALADHARGLLNVADLDAIKTNETVREYLKDGFENIKSLLDPMVQTQAHRRIKVRD
jgi:hypothetical protein